MQTDPFAPLPNDLVDIDQLCAITRTKPQNIYQRINRMAERGLVRKYEIKNKVYVSKAQFIAGSAVLHANSSRIRHITPMVKESFPSFGLADTDTIVIPVSTQQTETIRKLKAEADLKELSLAQKRGQLIDIDQVRDAAEQAAEILAREIERLPLLADDLAAEAATGGVIGLRRSLAAEARRIRASMAQAMRGLSAGSPAPREDAGDDDEAIVPEDAGDDDDA